MATREEALETIRLMGEHVIPKLDKDPEHRTSRFRARQVRRPGARAWTDHPEREEPDMSNPFSYENKRVVVTGAATGVGAGLLEVLAELGAAHVTVLDIKAPTGPHQTFLQTDLSDRAAVDAAIAAIDGPVDALFNNAGVADTMPPAP